MEEFKPRPEDVKSDTKIDPRNVHFEPVSKE